MATPDPRLDVLRDMLLEGHWDATFALIQEIARGVAPSHLHAVCMLKEVLDRAHGTSIMIQLHVDDPSRLTRLLDHPDIDYRTTEVEIAPDIFVMIRSRRRIWRVTPRE